MIPAASSAGLSSNTAQPSTSPSSNRAEQPQAPEASRSSLGEAAPSNGTVAPAKAVTAPEQSAIAPRLRDQETAERSDRDRDAPAGPPPAFQESYLERQAREAFDPPEPPATLLAERDTQPKTDASDAQEEDVQTMQDTVPEPPPTPTERAEAGFAETRTLASPKEPTLLDVSR